MITPDNFPALLDHLGFDKDGNLYSKYFEDLDVTLAADIKNKRFIYPPDLRVHEKQATNFAQLENFVVFECVHRLLDKGYRAADIELEKRWMLGHEAKGGRADICVHHHEDDGIFLIIECKTAGPEYRKALKILRDDGGQLFSYRQQEGGAKWLSLYASDFSDGTLSHENDIISCFDDPQIIELAQTDKTIKLYSAAKTAEDLHQVWKETYGSKLWSGLIFGEETTAYQIGIKPLRKRDLREFTPDDNIVSKFEEILRHNNVSDRENAFNKLTALFICKLVDEIGKTDDAEVEFQYKQGTDTYETLQDRLQRLHRDGMEQFMKEEVAYIPATYPDDLFQNFTGDTRSNAITDLKEKFRILKFYSNTHFAFKEVHNEELFLQNGKILVEMIQLFERYRIVYPSRHQFLGDMFEQLLSQGFKQNEGQFFTPMPITRFIWDSLPLKKLVASDEGANYPKIIDYACGAGHFLTEAVEAVNATVGTEDNDWVRNRVFGIEKDYRLARVAKISLFMNGSGEGTIIYGDGLDNHPEQEVTASSFDILVANPPYSVRAFKSHLALRNNTLSLSESISHDGGEIEVLFLERAAQLLNAGGVAAIIVPTSVLSTNTSSFIKARELLLQNFYIRAIVQLGTLTFGATGTNTAILFLERFNEPPRLAALAQDSVEAIAEQRPLDNWEDAEIYSSYLEVIGVDDDEYSKFLRNEMTLDEWEQDAYFSLYSTEFKKSAEFRRKTASRAFKQLSVEAQEKQKTGFFYQAAREVEMDKMLHFALTYDQSTTVVIAPSKNKEQKEFLGYSWSNRRGYEGISIKDPGGQLYDDDNRTAQGTIAHMIRSSFERNGSSPSNQPTTHASLDTFSTSHLLDFRSADFAKGLRLISEEQIRVTSKYEIKSLHQLVYVNKKKINPTSNPDQEFTYVDVSAVGKGTGTISFDQKIVGRELPSRATRGADKDDILIATVRPNLRGFALLSAQPAPYTVFSTGFSTLTIKDPNEIKSTYLYVLFQTSQVVLRQMEAKMGKGQYPSINGADLKSLQIPVPPEAIQKDFLERHKKIEKKYLSSRMDIEEYRSLVQALLSDMEIIDFDVD